MVDIVVDIFLFLKKRKYFWKYLTNTITNVFMEKNQKKITYSNGIARTLKMLRTSKGDYWIKQ